MIKKYIAEKDEIEAIKEVLDKILCLWMYDTISAKSENGAEISMSKKTFFEALEKELS